MICRRSGTFCAIAASMRASCASASPMISNCRSTADRKTMSPSKSAKLLPAVTAAITSAASRASHSRLFGSRCKDGLARAFDARLQVRIAHRTRFDQIDRPTQEPLQCFLQSEIRPERQRVGMCAIEFDQEIDVAPLGVEIAACDRTEKIEPTHVEAAAYRPQFVATQRDLVDHHGSGFVDAALRDMLHVITYPVSAPRPADERSAGRATIGGHSTIRRPTLPRRWPSWRINIAPGWRRVAPRLEHAGAADKPDLILLDVTMPDMRVDCGGSIVALRTGPNSQRGASKPM